MTILPLRLHIDQDALDFMTRFFDFHDESAKSSSPAEQPYLQRVEVRPVSVRLDYKPKKIDYAGLRSGRATEFMNFFILDSADIFLRHTIIYGSSNFARLHKSLEDVWMPDIRRNQLPSVLSGLNGVRTAVNVGQGVRDLVEIPIREYKKDGRLVRSISKGAAAFAKTTGSELTKFGAKLAVGAQGYFQGAEEYLSGNSTSKHAGQRRGSSRRTSGVRVAGGADTEWDDADLDDDTDDEPKRAISRYADQPAGILQGLRGAARSLERDILLTRDVIVAVSGEVRESGSATSAAKAVGRAAPTVVLRPLVGVSGAAGKLLMGAANTVDEDNYRRVGDVSLLIFLSKSFPISQVFEEPDISDHGVAPPIFVLSSTPSA